VLRAAHESVDLARERTLAELVAEHEGQIARLERRVNKLKDLLDSTETELRQLAISKGLDPGVASIYRSVQGLSLEDENFQRKKEMLVLIFEANVDLRKKIQGMPDAGGGDAEAPA
jgi:hypothetical protein